MEKINLIFKKIIILIIMIGSLVGIVNVNANNVPQTITIKEKKDMTYLTGSDAYIDNHSTYMKVLTNGTLAYCSGSSKQKAPGGETLKLVGEADAGLTYILKNGYPNKNFLGDSKKDYYITQAAIWEYFDRTRGTSNWKNVDFEGSPNGSMEYYVDLLADGAVNALKYDTSNIETKIEIVKTNNKLNLEDNYYFSSLITVKTTNTDGTYTVDLSKAPSGTYVKDENGKVKTTFKANEKFKVVVPKTATLQDVVITVKSSKTTYKSYDYRANDNAYYQNILVTTLHKNVINISDTLKFDYENTRVKISKQDITNKKELPGATLVVKDASGKVIESWVSTDNVYYMDPLPLGKYTLEETIAPNGYVLSKEIVEFEVKKDGSIKTVVMYNTPKNLTVIQISKQDITNKKELPGATLVVKDASGKVIESWVSTSEPHLMDKLPAGKYTLTETIAPEGYKLSTEVVEFEVKNDGSVKPVVMYNTSKDLTVVQISKQDITNKKELPGATLEVRDSENNIIDTWVSTSEPHLMEKLPAGKYTLTETIAPVGYELSKETISFEVKKDGTIQTVVMYNAPSIEIPKTDMNVSMFGIICGIILSFGGVALLFKYSKN